MFLGATKLQSGRMRAPRRREEDMTEKNMKDVIRSAYAARVRGDLEGALAPFSDDAVFLFNAEGVGSPGLGAPAKGKAAIRQAFAELIKNFRFSDWQELAL